MAGKVFEGTVKSNKMDKTIVVTVQRKFPEKRTGKIVSSNKSYMVHCEEKAILPGDKVQFCESRPFSKNKKWRFLKTLVKAEQAVGLSE